jgi:hypothetical protein
LTFTEEVLRINQRYLDEIVEAFDICPYARPAVQAGAVERRVILDEDPLEVIAELEKNPATEIGLLIFPRFALDADAFDRFVNELRDRDKARRPPPFAMAAFHPAGSFGTETPQRMIMFFRRSPDPTIQLVRFSALEAVKRGDRPGGKFLFDFSARGWAELSSRVDEKSVSERIGERNRETALREGLQRFEKIFAAIRADRDESYAKFGKPAGEKS